jgi:uncharacterized membrane protein
MVSQKNINLDIVRLVCLTLLIIGIIFRFTNLGLKIYWHDEVYTSMRAAGYTVEEINQDLFQDRLVPASELRQFIELKPDSTYRDTIRSLATEDPQHPPLYFLMARAWMQWFGDAIATSRLLPAIISLLSLPLMYALAMELFGSPLTALFSTALLASSPFDILFAQTARQYSLLTAVTIGSSWLLIRALRRFAWSDWILYGLSVAIGLYTHPLFGLTMLAHGGYVLFLRIGRFPTPSLKRRQPFRKPFSRFLVATAIALLLYTPWIIVLVGNLGRASATTDWTRAEVSLLYLAKLWYLSFTSLFIDLDFGFNEPFTYLLRLPILLFLILALDTLRRRALWPGWLFVITTIGIPFLTLALPDLILGGKRSAVSRYLIACYPGVQLMMGFWLADLVRSGRRLWQGAIALIAAGAIASSTVSALSETWWNKDLSYFNAEVAAATNDRQPVVVVSDRGDDFTNTGDLISMSDRLAEEVQLLLLDQPPDPEQLQTLPTGVDILTFRASEAMRQSFKAAGWQFQEVHGPGRLEQLSR